MPTLHGMTWDHPRGYDPLAATAEAYAQAHRGVRIVWEKRPLQAFADRPLDDLAARYDLIVIDHPHVGQVAREGYLVPLDETGREAELAALASQSLGGSHESYAWGGHQWALAIDAAAQVAAYRPDLLAATPATWDQVIALAQAGRVLWPVKPVDALMSFFTLAANRGTPCGADNGTLIAHDDAVAVLTVMRQLAEHVPERCLTMNPIETLDHLASRDDFAYCPLLYGYSNYARDGFGAKLVRFANIPALGDAGPRGSTLGGTGIAVSARTPHRDLAVDYAFRIASADCQKGLYFEAGGQPGNALAWRDEAVNAASHDFYRDTFETLNRSYVRPRYDGYLAFQDRGGDLVNACLAGGRDPASAAAALGRLYQETRT